VSKYFTYDSATVNGVAMTNVQGRIAEAFTCLNSGPPPCSSKITDEGFSYDARGQMVSYYQSSSNSGGYYNPTATYWEHGALKTVHGLGLGTITYGGLDGEGRVTTVSTSAGTNLVTGVTYNDGSVTNEPTGALLSVTLGTGDTQTFTYDPNTGRMTSYSASVGATPSVISGNLTWNSNGTLQKNKVSDGYNAANTQLCSYQYDDFVRIASVNCLNGTTNVWNQTFTYGSDAFDNLSKNSSGPGLSWNPGYNSSNNRYTLTGTSYDADGNLLTDTFHTYTWLPDGHVASIATGTTTASVTYDAFGNKVEENIGGVIHEYVSAFGVSAQMTGTTENATTVPLPGGVQALYSGGSLRRYRFPDWLGSIRAEASTARAFTESVAFAPFGERYALKGAPYSVDSFTGKPDQIVSDEYDFAAREEHNGQGRWISPDPLSDTGNKYSYADNNPLGKIDLYGMLATFVSTMNGQNTATEIGLGNDPTLSESHPQNSDQTPSTVDNSTPADPQQSGGGTAPAQQAKTEPTSLQVESQKDMTRSDPKRNYGIYSEIKYQVLDQNGKPIQSDTMQPMEHGTWGDGTEFSGPIVSKKPDENHTQADGTFVDKPVGHLQPRPMSEPIKMQQTITILMGGKEYTVRTQTYTVTSDGYGHGSITNNLGDIDVKRP
jgi:RHS repeat-associated protein